MKWLVKQLVRLAVLVAALAAVHPVAPASAASPCWKLLLNDWYDGRIDKTYPAACYRVALKHLPTDVDVYTSARTDIERALASAVRNAKKQGKPLGQVVVPPSRPATTTTTTTTTSKGTTSTSKPSTTTPTSTVPAGRKTREDGPVGSALGSVSTSADTVPLPLVILGALALLLVAAGLAGIVYRRYQARQSGP
jgi:cobalamin biosynthesis Mg chelatase CobN